MQPYHTEQITHLGAYGVAIKEGEILLVLQKNGPYAGKYDLPGGKIEFGESAEQALRREFAEEVGCGFATCQLLDNLTATIDVPAAFLRAGYIFHHIGMIYCVHAIHSLENDLKGELLNFWLDPVTLNQQVCSPLLWQVLEKSLFNTPQKAKNMVDLTHSLHEDIPSWEGASCFYKEITCDYADCVAVPPFRIQRLHMNAGIGTHMDAPAHCVPGGMTIDLLPIKSLIAPCAVIDVSSKSHECYSVSELDILIFESMHGPLMADQFVMIRTGWERYWNEPDRYCNNYIFPSVSLEAAQLLIKRQIVGLGIDTLSPDRADSGYPVHKILLGAGKYIVENATNLEMLPPTGSWICVLPIKVKDGTEAPVRLIALI